MRVATDVPESGCRYPDLAPLTAYHMHCRCDRCRAAVREYNKVRQPVRCDRCRQRAQILVEGHDLCWGCVTAEERQLIWEDTFRGRFGACGL